MEVKLLEIRMENPRKKVLYESVDVFFLMAFPCFNDDFIIFEIIRSSA